MGSLLRERELTEDLVVVADAEPRVLHFIAREVAVHRQLLVVLAVEEA